MLFDFAARPPEINSALMYSGAGAAPMMAAASAWNNLAAELSTAAASYESVISELSGEWVGPASASMAAAAAPYAAWMKSAAAATEHAAGQATASAAAYQTAFAMTVPPPVIAANRAQLAALVATNVLGQNTPAIAATEAQYGEMWAQDAAAMYGYAGSSASAAQLTPLTSPTPTTNPTGAGAQTAAVSAASAQSPTSLLTSLYDALFGSSTSTAAPSYTNGILSGPDGFFNDLISSGGNVGYLNDAFDVSGSFNGFDGLAFSSLFSGGGASAAAGSAAAAAAPAGLGAGLLAGTVTPATGAMAGTAAVGGAPVLAGMAQASSVGGLSVPATWSAATPDTTATTVSTAEWTADVDQGGGTTNVATGMPAVANAGRGGGGYGFGGPRYGVKPKVMPTRVLV